MLKQKTNYKSRNDYKKGFTFIEVIIIFTIVFIMTAVVMSMSYKDRAKKVVDTTAREIVSSIRETQNNALTGKQKGNLQLPCDFSYNINPNAYSMTASMRSIDGDCGEKEIFVPATPLPEGVKMTAQAQGEGDSKWYDVSAITFDVPYGGVSFAVGDKTNDEYKGAEIVIEKNDKKYYICVHSIGLIEELGRLDIDGDEHACNFGS
jgi:Tfp pilus assembly protein PilE